MTITWDSIIKWDTTEEAFGTRDCDVETRTFRHARATQSPGPSGSQIRRRPGATPAALIKMSDWLPQVRDTRTAPVQKYLASDLTFVWACDDAVGDTLSAGTGGQRLVIDSNDQIWCSYSEGSSVFLKKLDTDGSILINAERSDNKWIDITSDDYPVCVGITSGGTDYGPAIIDKADGTLEYSVTDTTIKPVHVDVNDDIYAVYEDSGEYFLLKYDNTLSALGSAQSLGTREIYSIGSDSSGNIYVSMDNYVVKYLYSASLPLTLDWFTNVGDENYDIDVDPSGNSYLCGNQRFSRNVWKLDSSGNIDWDYQAGVYSAYGIKYTSGGIYVGTQRDFSTGYNIWKLQDNGTSASLLDAQGQEREKINSIQVDSNGDIIVSVFD